MTQRDVVGSGDSRTPDSKLGIMITKSLHPQREQRDCSSVGEAAAMTGRSKTLDEEEDLDGTEPALMLRLFEAFRDRLFHFAVAGDGEDTAIVDLETEIGEEAIDEVLERPDIGDEILFAFLTLLHRELSHSIASLVSNCPHQHSDN